jgi:hypothetical protein
MQKNKGMVRDDLNPESGKEIAQMAKQVEALLRKMRQHF